MARRMIVSWGGTQKVAPCTVEEFAIIHSLWSGVWDGGIMTASKALRSVGYTKPEAVELISLCRRHDRGELVWT